MTNSIKQIIVNDIKSKKGKQILQIKVYCESETEEYELIKEYLNKNLLETMQEGFDAYRKAKQKSDPTV